jgi:hypothetical protein
MDSPDKAAQPRMVLFYAVQPWRYQIGVQGIKTRPISAIHAVCAYTS